MTPVELLGTTRDDRGAICGPYEQERAIDHGYASDRTVRLHSDRGD